MDLRDEIISIVSANLNAFDAFIKKDHVICRSELKVGNNERKYQLKCTKTISYIYETLNCNIGATL